MFDCSGLRIFNGSKLRFLRFFEALDVERFEAGDFQLFGVQYFQLVDAPGFHLFGALGTFFCFSPLWLRCVVFPDSFVLEHAPFVKNKIGV